MASKFDKAKGAKDIKKVAQDSNAKANLIVIKYYKDEQLQDYPRNNEDITHTEDIEQSIEEQGFTDPLEITDYGMPEDQFMIVSGHRRRMAGRNKGMKEFPCILRHFRSDSEVYNYVLFSNAQRDSAKDPLLFAKRYKMHEEYLREAGFKGSMREEIARRLGLKPAQADRYNQFNKVILPIWDMVREGTIGMSSVTDSGLYTHEPEEQEEILQIMQECLDNDNELTRPIVKKIVNAYREGKKTWLAVIQIEMELEQKPVNNHQAGVSLMNINTEEEETKEEKEPSPLDRNNEINYDFSHREGLESGQDSYEDERMTQDDYAAIEKAAENEAAEKTAENGKEEKKQLTHEEKLLQAGNKIMKNVVSLDEQLEEFYSFQEPEDAERAITSMKNLVFKMLAEMQNISAEYQQEEKFDEVIGAITKEVRSYNRKK